jgi:ribosomal protein S18 acetylase RimI-like enzyme
MSDWPCMRVRDVTCDMLLRIAEENDWPTDYLFAVMAACPAWDAPWDEEVFKAMLLKHGEEFRS